MENIKGCGHGKSLMLGGNINYCSTVARQIAFPALWYRLMGKTYTVYIFFTSKFIPAFAPCIKSLGELFFKSIQTRKKLNF